MALLAFIELNTGMKGKENWNIGVGEESSSTGADGANTGFVMQAKERKFVCVYVSVQFTSLTFCYTLV